MESQIIAELCRQRGIRCMAIKGVSDGIDDDLSPILGGFEIIRIPKIARHVLFSPSTWGTGHTNGATELLRSHESGAWGLGHSSKLALSLNQVEGNTLE